MNPDEDKSLLRDERTFGRTKRAMSFLTSAGAGSEVGRRRAKGRRRLGEIRRPRRGIAFSQMHGEVVFPCPLRASFFRPDISQP